ncbi:hypothetical protein [Terrabacter carboxydivorans]
MRDAIASSVANNVKAYDIATWCASLGLADQAPDEDPYRSKFTYVKSRLIGLPMTELLKIARRLLDEWDDEALQELVTPTGLGGVDGEMRNLIFASTGPKPKIVLRDAINNTIEVVENGQYCLFYDRPLTDAGLTWSDMVEWWAVTHLDTTELSVAGHHLWRRMNQSLVDSEPERILFRTYTARYAGDPTVPALIPQVYLHYDPYVHRRGVAAPLFRQRMDFLLLLPGRRRVVLEVDGRHHYARTDGTADPGAYARMVAEDRMLRLLGYEVYRFGGAEFVDAETRSELLTRFFDDLLGQG